MIHLLAISAATQTFSAGLSSGGFSEVYVEFIRGLVVLIAALMVYAAKRLREMPAQRVTIQVPVEQAAWNDLRITEQLAHLRDRVDAQRAYLSRFHNGDHFNDDSELLKKTRTHEVVRDGVAYQSEHFRGMLCSTMVIESGPSWTMVNDLPKGKFKWLCMIGGVDSVARCAIRKGGKIVGFVGLDFDHATESPPENIEALCEFAVRIEQFL
jgi:hypothetical protein